MLLSRFVEKRRIVCGKSINGGWLGRSSVLFCLLFMLAFPVFADHNSNFALIKLQRGIELQIPKGWWLLGDDYNRVIKTSVEAAMDLSGIGLSDKPVTNLIAANSMPRSTYAAVRVDSTIPTSLLPSDFKSVTTNDVLELQAEMLKYLRKLLQLQGGQLIEFFGTRIDKIAGYPAIVTEYRRIGSKGSVFVQINQIYTEGQEFRINLSYRESEVALWKPVLGKIRQSIVIKKP